MQDRPGARRGAGTIASANRRAYKRPISVQNLRRVEAGMLDQNDMSEAPAGAAMPDALRDEDGAIRRAFVERVEEAAHRADGQGFRLLGADRGR